MFTRMIATAALAICTVAGTASAMECNAEQQEIWKVEQQQWKMSAAEDMSWIDTLLHPDMTFWEAGSRGAQRRRWTFSCKPFGA